MQHHRRNKGRWAALAIIVALIAAHLIAYHLFRHERGSHLAIPGALMGGVLVLLVAKHLGLLAMLIRTLNNQIKKRCRS